MDHKNIRGRFAPSPTGLMHVGNARTALVAWLSARSKKGTFVWRLEDLDTPRVVRGMSQAAEEDVAWLGIDWDEGPGRGGEYGPYEQSARFLIYEHALQTLLEKDRIFPCTYSRKDLQSMASAPHGVDVTSAYPATLRPKKLEEHWFLSLQESTIPYASIRFKVDAGITTFHDWLLGEVQQDVGKEIGDYVVKRRDGMYAYQLAVVVDDIAMQISEVVRGTDLLDSTARQIQLIKAFGGATPHYAHVPLVRNAAGEKLSKRDAGLTLRSLRKAGVQPEQLVGYFAHSLGLIKTLAPTTVNALIESFSWGAITKNDWILPADIISVLKAI